MSIVISDLQWLYDMGKISYTQFNYYWNEVEARHSALVRMTKHNHCDCMDVVLDLHGLLSIIKLRRFQKHGAAAFGGYREYLVP